MLVYVKGPGLGRSNLSTVCLKLKVKVKANILMFLFVMLESTVKEALGCHL